MFAFQSEIARSVSNALSVRMATDAPAPGGTANVRAYEAYLQGKALLAAITPAEIQREARNYLDPAKAVETLALPQGVDEPRP